jgi:hypothetical protein
MDKTCVQHKSNPGSQPANPGVGPPVWQTSILTMHIYNVFKEPDHSLPSILMVQPGRG